jgi:hypothetical protein
MPPQSLGYPKAVNLRFHLPCTQFEWIPRLRTCNGEDGVCHPPEELDRDGPWHLQLWKTATSHLRRSKFLCRRRTATVVLRSCSRMILADEGIWTDRRRVIQIVNGQVDVRFYRRDFVPSARIKIVRLQHQLLLLVSNPVPHL